MTKPSKPEFDELISAATRCERKNLIEPFESMFGRIEACGEIDAAQVRLYLNACDKASEQDRARAEQLPAWVWFESQSAVREAFASMDRSYKKKIRYLTTKKGYFTWDEGLEQCLRGPTKDEIIRGMRDSELKKMRSQGELDREVERRQAFDYRVGVLKQILKEVRDARSCSLTRAGALAQAYSAYFYSNRAAEIEQRYEEINQLAKSMLQVLARSARIQQQGYLTKGDPLRKLNCAFATKIDRMCEKLAANENNFLQRIVKHKNSTVKERVLVFDLFLVCALELKSRVQQRFPIY